MMPTTETRRLRTAAGCTLQDAGQDWDAVRVQRSIGLTAMGILNTRCGAVIEGPQPALYFFVQPGSTAAWDLLNVETLGLGHTLTIPPPRRTQGPGPHWRICPGDTDWLTDAAALHAAIEDAIAPAEDPES
jgi:hypothetical protein